MQELAVTGGEKWIIVWEKIGSPKGEKGRYTSGIVGHHSIYGPIGVHPSEESAVSHAKRLALTHPGAAFAVARVSLIITAPNGFEDVKAITPNWKCTGDLYAAAGCGEDTEARGRLLEG